MARQAQDKAELIQLREQVADLEQRLQTAREKFAEQEAEIERLKAPRTSRK